MKKAVAERGFTLVELMVVVVILGMLAALVTPGLVKAIAKARIGTARTEIRTLEMGVHSFNLDLGRFPSTEEGLDVLVTDTGETGWDGPYLESRKLPKDPWKAPYGYTEPGERSVHFDIFSAGPDKEPNTNDDIGNWIEEESS